MEKNLKITNPYDIKSWVKLIDSLSKEGKLNPELISLISSHEINPSGYVINFFSVDIAKKASLNLLKYSEDPVKNIEQVIKELIKWKTILQCAHSHDVSKGYFIDAEPYIEYQWNNIIWPLIMDFDFSVVLDLACGHGRNSEYLRKKTKKLHLLDVNKSCIDFCFDRFGNEKEGTDFYYHVTDGNHLNMIPDNSITFVYSWDSMVHFDKLVVHDYLFEIHRVLRPGGISFLHHSNYGEKSPNSDWAKNNGTRSDMSKSLMQQYSSEIGLEVFLQKVQGRAEGWGEDAMDCVSILKKPN